MSEQAVYFNGNDLTSNIVKRYQNNNYVEDFSDLGSNIWNNSEWS